MQVTLNTSNYTNNYYIPNNQPVFNGSMPIKSAFLNPFKKGYENFVHRIAKYYTAPLYQSKLARKCAENADKLDGPAGHMQTVGSFIVTGMYMEQTMTNKSLDEKKKKTLAVNQLLTLVASTLGAYIVDGKLNKMWENLTRKYIAKNLDISKNELDERIKEWNVGEKQKFDYKVSIGDIAKDAEFKKGKVEDYIEKTMTDSDIVKYVKGMGILKKMLVFGIIYRFISPVAVTPIANWIGNKLFYQSNKYVQTAHDSQTKNAVKADA